MTRKDYELIANAIRKRIDIARGFPNLEHRQSAVEILVDLADDLALDLLETNPRFNSRIFLEACRCVYIDNFGRETSPSFLERAKIRKA